MIMSGSKLVLLSIVQVGTGLLIREFLLETRCFRSGTHDFVVLHLEDEEELLCFLRERNEIVNTVQLSEGLLSSGKEVRLIGHDLIPIRNNNVNACSNGIKKTAHDDSPTNTEDFSKRGEEEQKKEEEEEEEEVLVPVWRKGKVNVVREKEKRIFVTTDIPVVMGMCGGPAILSDTGNTCIGILEALVKPIPCARRMTLEPAVRTEWEIVENNAVLVDSREIINFLRNVVESSEFSH